MRRRDARICVTNMIREDLVSDLVDIAIWRRLVAGAATAADLEEIRVWPVARRVAYLGAVEALAARADIAGLRALEGARGYEAVHTIVAALDHADPAVRTAALDAL